LARHVSPTSRPSRSSKPQSPKTLAQPLAAWNHPSAASVRVRPAGTLGQRALDGLHAKASAEWQAIRKGWCDEWFRQRVREYTNIHGYVSAGVSALLSRCSTAHANADYLTALGYSLMDHELVLKAQSFANTAKAMELAAYEIACREGRAKRDTDALNESKGGRLAAALSDGSAGPKRSKATRVDGDLADVASPFDTPPGGVKDGAPIPAPTLPTETLSHSLTPGGGLDTPKPEGHE